MPNVAPGLKAKHNQAAAIVAQMTLEEKARFCSGRNFWHLEGLDHLDLPSVMVTDGPHGLRKQSRGADHVGLNKSVPATCFPTACALAASWDVDLINKVGVALGEQCVAEHVTVLLGPGMNIKRHPLCGRNFEYFSEDPLLTGKIAAAFVNGVQSQGVGTSIKHFAANNQEQGRMFIDAIVDERTLREIYLRGFEIAVREAQPWTVMCAYNRLNGEFCSEHDWLLNKVLRDDWGFEGLVVTDWGAANDRVHGVASGLDLEMPGGSGINDALVLKAVQSGALAEQDLDTAIQRSVSLSLLGSDLHQRDYTADQQAHHQLAKQAAIESAVLLKNEAQALPLNASQHIAIVGAFAKKPRFQGAGSSQVNPTQINSAWDALLELVGQDHLTYAAGYDPKHSIVATTLVEEAVAIARDADVVVLFAGLPGIYESEGFDRGHLSLPEQHNQLIEAVSNANPKTIVVLANGAPVSMPWIDQVPAVLEGYLAGQAGGSAMAELILGMANPSGKLAETFQLKQSDTPADQNFPGRDRQVQYREGLYVGYRYFDSYGADVLFPFGHGLSYTSFEYENLSISNASHHQGSTLELSVDIVNSGPVDGAEVVQLYVRPIAPGVYRPSHELRGFCKIEVAQDTRQTVTFTLKDDAFAYFDVDSQSWVVEAGQYEIEIGASSRDIRCRQLIEVHSTQRASSTPSGPDLRNNDMVTDKTFASMLGKPVPPPESSRPFHRNSSILEVSQTWLGAKFKARVVKGFMQNMGGGQHDETLNKMFEEMANNMPLRSLGLLGGGKIGPQQIDLLLALLNHRYVRAFKLWWQSTTTSK